MLQGLGAAGIMSVNGALIRFIYPRRWLGRGVGLNATVGSIASALGPSVASVILAVAPWPYLFAVNVPLGILGAVIALRTLPMTPLSGVRFDLTSAALQAVAFGTLLFGVSEMGHGDSWVHVAVELVVAAITGFVLVMRQLSRTAPLLPVDLLRIPLFALSVGTSVCSFIAQAIGQVSMPFLFEHRFQMDQVMTGLLMTPWPLVVAVVAPFAGRLADKYPAGLLGGGGPISPRRSISCGECRCAGSASGSSTPRTTARSSPPRHRFEPVARAGCRRPPGCWASRWGPRWSRWCSPPFPKTGRRWPCSSPPAWPVSRPASASAVWRRCNGRPPRLLPAKPAIIAIPASQTA
jgi:MFS family permease